MPSRPHRALLPLAAGLAAALAACTGSSPAPGPAPLVATAQVDPAALLPRELTADQQVSQALSRLTFGPRPGDAQRVRAMGVDQWIDLQLHPERIDDPAVARLLAQLPTLAMSASDLEEKYPPPAQVLARLRRPNGRDSALSAADSQELRRVGREANRPVAELVTSRVARATVSERQLQEVMTDFWENHFTVYVAKGPRERYFLVDYDRDVIRPSALGKFRDLLGAVAASPAMLFYLDNWESVADSAHPTLAAAREPRFGVLRPGRGGTRIFAPGAIVPPGAYRRPNAPALPGGRPRPIGINENYARELLELHTLGVDGGYTQQDIIEVARAFTGWTIAPPRLGGGSLFRPETHDAGPKTVLGHKLPFGRGVEDGEDVLDIVARHPATAHFIALKLARRFVSDTPPAELVDRAAATFTRTDGDIREVVRTIVTSPEFFSRAAWRAKVKSPFEVVVSAVRAMGAEPDLTPRTAQVVNRLGQPLFGHQAPNGWPETGEAWMNTGAILNRINFGLAVAAGRLPGVTLDRWGPAAALRDTTREAQVDGVVAAILGGAVSPDTRAVMLSGEHPLLAAGRLPADSAMAMGADSAGVPDMMAPDDPPGRPDRRDARRLMRDAALRPNARGGPAFGPLPALSGLAQVLGLALGSPEFQRR
jgi:uncharacterized protein (DUF1800 family)